PRALNLFRGRPHLTELLEDLLVILRGDTDPRVGDRDLYQPILWHCTDINPPTLRRELDRIRQQVQHDRSAAQGLYLAETRRLCYKKNFISEEATYGKRVRRDATRCPSQGRFRQSLDSHLASLSVLGESRIGWRTWRPYRWRTRRPYRRWQPLG